MPSCCAVSCTYRHWVKKTPGKSLHKFPFSREDILLKWIENVNRKDWMPTKYSVICSSHFEEDCFDRTGQTVRLKPDAVPTVFHATPLMQKTLAKKRKLYNDDLFVKDSGVEEKKMALAYCKPCKLTEGDDKDVNPKPSAIFELPSVPKPAGETVIAELVIKNDNKPNECANTSHTLSKRNCTSKATFTLSRNLRHPHNSTDFKNSQLNKEKELLQTQSADAVISLKKQKETRGSMNICVAHGCTNRPWRKTSDITFHAFPKNKALRQEWIRATQRENWEPSKNSVLCSAHFTSDKFDRSSPFRVRLVTDAIPTVFSSIPGYVSEAHRKPDKLLTEETVEDVYPRPSAIFELSSMPKPTEENVIAELVIENGCNFKQNSSHIFHTIPKRKCTSKVASTLSKNRRYIRNNANFKKFLLYKKKKLMETQLTDTVISLKRQLEECKSELSNLEHGVKKLFSTDQIEFLKLNGSLSTKKLIAWSEETFQRSLQLFSAVGTKGYEYMQSIGYPLPSFKILTVKDVQYL